MSFDVKRPAKKPITVIRTASGNELAEYEKRKVALTIQEPVVEVVRANDILLPADRLKEEAKIKLQGTVKRDNIISSDIADDTCWIKCELE